jgi:molybdate transport system substrate-binding protein
LALQHSQSPSVTKQVSSAELNDGYQPIKQRMVLIKNPTPDAVRLYEFMRTPKAKEILRSYGYLISD